jgi:SAM-dependent methyltransferase
MEIIQPAATMAHTQLYHDDLAHIHIEGYDFHWKGAAPAVLQWLRGAGITSGTVVDLGCGGGQWLQRLAAKGYDPVGIDVSAAMIRQARKLVPRATLIHGSFANVDLPHCDAVTSLGEPLNYLDGARSFKRTLKNVYRALRPGGVFIFDVRVPPAESVETRVAARVGDNWACIALIDEDPATGRLVRRITTFRRHGVVYRRGEELHELHLFPHADIHSWLSNLGFRVRTIRQYGDYRLTPRQVIFFARKLK